MYQVRNIDVGSSVLYPCVSLPVRAEISMLESEKQELLKELRLAESRTNQMRDEEHTDTLITLLEAKGQSLWMLLHAQNLNWSCGP